MGINYKSLMESVNKLGPKPTAKLFGEALKTKDVRLSDCDFGALFESCFGWHAFQQCRQAAKSVDPDVSIVQTMEAAGATSTAAFTNISGQIVYSAILDKYENEEFVFTKLIPTVPTKFNGEKIAGITRIGDEALTVEEGGEFPLIGVSETYIHTPSTIKRGFRVALTKEAVFFDRTGVLLDRAGEGGEFLGLNKEKRAADCVIDENAGAVSAMTNGHRYHWRDTSIATYGDNSGTHTWDNLQASNALVDWTDVEAAWLLLKAMTDPDTGEPTNFMPKHLVVTPQLQWTAMRIKRATNVRTHVGGYATSGNLVELEAPSPIPFEFEIVSSQQLASRLATDTNWFFGDIGRAFRYMENWPIKIQQAPPNSEDEFKRDIIVQYRVDERGAYSTWEPRAMVRNTA